MQADQKSRPRWTAFLAGGIAGAVVAYLADPDRGRARRVRSSDQARAAVRRTTRRTARAGRRISAMAYAAKMRREHAGKDAGPRADDPATLVDKVRSEALGRAGVPKGRISVSAEEDGTVVLRGACESQEEIEAVEAAVAKVAGVAGVRNLLHLTGTPAPNVVEALRAGTQPSGNGSRTR